MAIPTGLPHAHSLSKTYNWSNSPPPCCRDGRILSGGMDKLLCLWDSRLVKCENLSGHNGSISKVKVDDNNVAISAGYDSSLLVWNLDTKECL